MINNSKPEVFYGLHMAPGVAEYRDPGADPYRILVNESTIKQMDPSLVGKPVYVRHKDEVDVTKLSEIDGWVVESFFNEKDGKHWCKFIVVTDKGNEAIKKGWRLSNAYVPKQFGPGGLWHGVDYAKEVLSGEYEHLAIVPDPRYDESVIMNAEDFKNYNESKSIELKRLANSKGEKSVLKLFKKEKVENSADFDQMMVQLPLSKQEMTLNELVNAHDKVVNMHGYASEDHMVNLGDEEMSVKDLKDCYGKMKNAEKERLMKEEEMKKNADLDGGEKEAEKQKAASDKTENADMDGDMDNKKSNSFFENLSKAHLRGEFQDPTTVDLNKAARGKARYGSGK